MAKYVFVVDESGCFNNNEKYIILGGVLYKKEDATELKEYFMPIYDRYCKILGVGELKGNNLQKLSLPMMSHIGHKKEILPVAFIIDKEKSFIFDKYKKISFKYNKAIEWMIRRLDEEKIIDIRNDEISITIDELNLSANEKLNLLKWLPENLKCVKVIKEKESKKSMGIQLADIVVNSFSKNKIYGKQTHKHRLLNPVILFFLKETEEIYIYKGEGNKL